MVSGSSSPPFIANNAIRRLTFSASGLGHVGTEHAGKDPNKAGMGQTSAYPQYGDPQEETELPEVEGLGGRQISILPNYTDRRVGIQTCGLVQNGCWTGGS
jgi:hypothetical protein